jgi:hypothetical protein
MIFVVHLHKINQLKTVIWVGNMTAACMSTVLPVDIQYPISHFILFLLWGNYIFICIPGVDERSDRIKVVQVTMYFQSQLYKL